MPSTSRRPYVFVSYSRVDESKAKALTNELERLGHRIWRYIVSIPGGAEWFTTLENALRDARAVVVLVSNASAKSDWVAYEYGFAIGAKVPIVAVALSEYAAPDPVRRFQMVKYSIPNATAKTVSNAIQKQVKDHSRARAGLPRLRASFVEYDGKLSRIRDTKPPSLELELWIEGAPLGTRSVSFEILDRNVRDRQWSVRRKARPGAEIREFLTDEDFNIYGDVEIWARGVGPKSGEWSIRSTLLEALSRHYSGQHISAEIRRGLKQIRMH